MEGSQLKTAKLFEARLRTGGADTPSSPALPALLCSSQIRACCVTPSVRAPAFSFPPSPVDRFGSLEHDYGELEAHSSSPVFWW